MTVAERLVLKRQRHLKWRALDPLETVLMMLCGLLLFGFCTTVILDILTREIGRPWLWLQEVTSTFFIYGIFVGAAVATRRSDHLNLTAVSESLHGSARLAVETIIRLVVMVSSRRVRANPKSRTFTPDFPIIMLLGLRSR